MYDNLGLLLYLSYLTHSSAFIVVEFDGCTRSDNTRDDK